MGGGSKLNTDEQLSANEIFDRASKRAFRGGISGSAAMLVQVGSLMWMRTTMNYQYRYGGSSIDAIKTLYKEGGIPRFYRGVGFALIQGPMSRFGDTAANSGVLSYLNARQDTKDLPVGIKTGFASFFAGLFRIALMPVDACKTIMQVEGKEGLAKLRNKVKIGGPTVLFHGAGGAFGATAAGHYPWFVTFNYLDEHMPWKNDGLGKKLCRNAFNGLAASMVSDVVSNSLRVLKTYRQTSTVPVGYGAAIKDIISKEGITGLMFRGLGTRIVAHGVNGMVFTVAWKFFEEEYFK